MALAGCKGCYWLSRCFFTWFSHYILSFFFLSFRFNLSPPSLCLSFSFHMECQPGEEDSVTLNLFNISKGIWEKKKKETHIRKISWREGVKGYVGRWVLLIWPQTRACVCVLMDILIFSFVDEKMYNYRQNWITSGAHAPTYSPFLDAQTWGTDWEVCCWICKFLHIFSCKLFSFFSEANQPHINLLFCVNMGGRLFMFL